MTDEQLDALAERLWIALRAEADDEEGMRAVAREAARWAEEQERELGTRLAESQAEVARLRAALVEVMEYEGGSESPLEDQYLVDRIRAALEPTR